MSRMSNTLKELVVISGKGGTGKTSVVASFAALAGGRCVLADCDVDAADLHLALTPRAIRREPFAGGKRARVRSGYCTACGRCEQLCRFDAIFFDGPRNGRVDKTYRVDPIACEGCGVCTWLCPAAAIEFAPAVNGEWYVSETRCGPMVPAKLGVAEEKSGKLVSLVRNEAGAIARQRGSELVLIYGSPRIGCPVIASITGAHLVLIVTEPTLSGLHDLGRVADVARHFGVPGMVCVNKWDLNPAVTAQIEQEARRHELMFGARVRYERAVTDAQIQGKSLVEYQRNGAATEIRQLWAHILEAMSVPVMPERKVAS